MTLHDQLVSRQQQVGLPDAQFAAAIGISRPLWNLIRRRLKPLTPRTIHKAVQRFPDLAPYVLLELMGDPEKEK